MCRGCWRGYASDVLEFTREVVLGVSQVPLDRALDGPEVLRVYSTSRYELFRLPHFIIIVNHLISIVIVVVLHDEVLLIFGERGVLGEFVPFK